MRYLLFFIFFILCSCSTLKSWVGLGGGEKTSEKKSAEMIAEESVVKYTDNDNMPVTAAREYKRMVRQRLEEESHLNAQAGSMWVMEGQGAYLFAQNKARREGDFIDVKMEGAAQSQVETKITVIKKLLKQLEDEERKIKEQQEAEKLKAQLAQGASNNQNSSLAQRTPAVAPSPPSEEKNSDKESKDEVKVDVVPARIVERQPDGNYRIRGQQPFMIGKREYKVIVTGILRPEDFSEGGVSSSKLLDPQYEVVSWRRKE